MIIPLINKSILGTVWIKYYAKGKILNDLYIQSGLKIMNGRTIGDMLGRLTCHTPRGSSVVDCIIASQSLFNCISYFQVHDFMGELSDHCQLFMSLKVYCRLFQTKIKKMILCQKFQDSISGMNQQLRYF